MAGQRVPLPRRTLRRRRAGGASDVDHALHHRDTTIQNNNAPRLPAPKNIVGAPSRMTRSARCAIPTRQVRPRPSARARVYETSSDAVSATKQATTARVSRSGATPPRRKNTAIPVNSADSPTRSSVESKKAPNDVLIPPSRATRPSTMSNRPETMSRNPPQWIFPSANAAAEPTITRVPAAETTLGRTRIRISSLTIGVRAQPTTSRAAWGMRFMPGGN